MGFLDDDFDPGDDYRAPLIYDHPINNMKLIGPFLAQGEKWCGKGGRYVAIAEMGAGHAAATVNFLLRRARDIALMYALSMGSSVAHDSIVMNEAEARRWLLGWPLLDALVARAQAGGEAQSRYPWEG